jgi:hypothetical protein
MPQFVTGAAFIDITPEKPQFLHGYPYVERVSEGTNDRLLSTALYIADGGEQVMLITNDLLYVGKESVSLIRLDISKKTNVPVANILIAATHTHSGPVTIECAVSANDPVVPPVDLDYIQYFENQVVCVACEAFQNAVPSQISFATANSTGVGTNRRDPSWASDPEVPLIIIKDIAGKYIACLMVCNMHPTVMHEDSKLFSGDFPAYARKILNEKYLGNECPVLYFTGAAGNQSPRYVTKSNTFEEAACIGDILAASVGNEMKKSLDTYLHVPISCRRTFVDLPKRQFPSPEEAEVNRIRAVELLNSLRNSTVSKQAIRTAEVDWFGAEELLCLSEQSRANELERFYNSCLPAEIQIIRIGDFTFVAWPGEIFVEYALKIKEKYQHTFLITLANGELQGYITTVEAETNNYYEASNSLFHYSGGPILLSETFKLMDSF